MLVLTLRSENLSDICFTYMPHDLHQGGERIEGMKPDFVELGFFYAVFI